MADSFIPLKFKIDSGGNPTAWAEYQNGETAVLPGNLNISGNSRRITADFNSADPTAFQEQTANNRTLVYAAPSGTATEAGYVVRNAAALTNCAIGVLRVNATTVSVESNVISGGTPLPLSLMTAGVIRMRLNNDGSVEFPTDGTRIRGNFASGPGSFNNRVIFQSTGNSQTAITAIPSGTGNVTALQLFSSSDPENSSRGSFNLVSSQELSISASKSGTGTYPPITFSTGDLERMRITTTGQVQYGQTDITGMSNGSQNKPGSYIVSTTGSQVNQCGSDAGLYISKPAGYSSNAFQYYFVNNVQVGSITTTGSATAYNTSSDYRLKEDVESLGSCWEYVKALRPVRYHWTGNPTVGWSSGFLAHELQEILPEAVTGEKDAVDENGEILVQGVDYSKLVPVLTAALQESIRRIEALEEEVAILKGAN